MSDILINPRVKNSTMSIMYDYYINMSSECIIQNAFISCEMELVFTFNVQYNGLTFSFIFCLNILKSFYHEII